MNSNFIVAAAPYHLEMLRYALSKIPMRNRNGFFLASSLSLPLFLIYMLLAASWPQYVARPRAEVVSCASHSFNVLYHILIELKTKSCKS